MDNTRKVIAIGYGSTEYAGNMSDTLLKVELNVIDSQECYSKYHNTFYTMTHALSKGIDMTHQFCVNVGMKDTCQV